MSAFIVNHNHINAIVRWACRNYVKSYHGNPSSGWAIAGREQETVELLYKENVKSYNHRYNEDEGPYKIVYNPFATDLTPVQVIKACHCLGYQSCEHDGWEDSDAKAILDDIEAAAVRALPGYEDAEWEIPELEAA